MQDLCFFWFWREMWPGHAFMRFTRVNRYCVEWKAQLSIFLKSCLKHQYFSQFFSKTFPFLPYQELNTVLTPLHLCFIFSERSLYILLLARRYAQYLLFYFWRQGEWKYKLPYDIYSLWLISKGRDDLQIHSRPCSCRFLTGFSLTLGRPARLA